MAGNLVQWLPSYWSKELTISSEAKLPWVTRGVLTVSWMKE